MTATDQDLPRALTRARALPGDEDRAAAAARRVAQRAAREGRADLAYCTIASPLGLLLAAASPRGLVMLAYADGREDALLGMLAGRLSPRIVCDGARLDGPRRELEEYFEGRRRRFDIELDWSLVSGPFGRRVLRATAAIPFGDVSSYREVAARAGSEKAARAAGNALGANPMPIVVPCHRILHRGGGLGGYTGGLERKRFLLALEGVTEG